MKLENQVCSLELAKRLKELGVRQESLYFWWRDNFGLESSKKESEHLENHKPNNPQNGWDYFSAFTVAELGEMLPLRLRILKKITLVVTYKGSKHWFVPKDKEKLIFEMKCDDTEANARAKILIYLLENKLITPPKDTSNEMLNKEKMIDDNSPVYLCDTCNTTAGRNGCNKHRSLSIVKNTTAGIVILY